MQSDAAEDTRQDGHGGERQRCADENLDNTTPPAVPGADHIGSPRKASTYDVDPTDSKVPPSRVARSGSPRKASTKSPQRKGSSPTVTSPASVDRDDSMEQHTTQLSRHSSRHSKSSASRRRHKDSAKCQRRYVSSTSLTDDARSPMSTNLQSSNTAYINGAVNDSTYTTPQTAVASKGDLIPPLSDTSYPVSPATGAASTMRRDTLSKAVTLSNADGEEVETSTKSRASQRRRTITRHKDDDNRPDKLQNTFPTQPTKMDAIPGKGSSGADSTSPQSSGEGNLFSALTSPESLGHATATIQSCEEYQSPMSPVYSASEGPCGESTLSVPISAQRHVSDETIYTGSKSALRGALKRKASRVSIRPSDAMRKDSESRQTGKMEGKAGKRSSKASFNEEAIGEKAVTASSTRRFSKATVSRRASRMSIRSFPTDSSLRAIVPQEKSLLFMVGVAFGVILTVVVASIILHLITRSDPASLVECRSVRCTQVMDELHAIVDPNADPCRDFYGYVCSTWMNSGGSFLADNVNRSLTLIMSALRMSQNTDGNDKDGTSVLLQVHASCQQYVVKGRWTLEAVLAEVDEPLGLSTFARASSFGEAARFLLKASMKMGLATIIETDMIRHQMDVLFCLSVGKSLITRFKTFKKKRKLFHILLRTLSYLGHVKDVRAEAHAVMQVDFAVYKIVHVLDAPEATVSFSKALDNTLEGVSVQEWLDCTNEWLAPSRQLKESEPVFTSGLIKIRSVLNEMSRRGVRSASLYLAAYLSMHVIWIESIRQRVKGDRLRSSSFCLNMAARVLTLSWPRLVSKLIPVPLDTAEVVATVFDNILKASKGLGVFSWLNEEKHLEVAQKIANTSLLTRLAGEEGIDYSGFRPDDVNITITASNDTTFPMKRFVAVYIRALIYDRALMFEHPPTRANLMMARDGHTGTVRYVEEIATILVPSLYQMEPYAYSSSEGYIPQYINHGTLGVLLASELSKIAATYGSGSSIGSPGLAERPVARTGRFTRNDASEWYKDTLYCLLDLHASLGFEHNVSGSAQAQHAELFRRAHGMRLAYNALLDSFRASSPDYGVFSTYWPQAQWAFFVRACLMLCAKDQTPSPLSPRENCLLPLHNMDEFAGAFGCRGKPDFIKGGCHM